MFLIIQLYVQQKPVSKTTTSVFWIIFQYIYTKKLDYRKEVIIYHIHAIFSLVRRAYKHIHNNIAYTLPTQRSIVYLTHLLEIDCIAYGKVTHFLVWNNVASDRHSCTFAYILLLLLFNDLR